MLAFDRGAACQDLVLTTLPADAVWALADVATRERDATAARTRPGNRVFLS